MKIDRPQLLSQLREFSLGGHGIVTGAPGVGKTIAVSLLARDLLAENRGALLVGVADLGHATDEDILAAVPHGGDLIETLRTYFADRESPGVIVIDGFDAARDPTVRERVLRFVRRLLANAAGQWHVLVTVRLYDAAKSPDLLALFPSESGGREARHLEIPLLTWDELEGAVQGMAGFPKVVAHASPTLRELLRLPFNLWLMEQVWRGSQSTEQVGTIGSYISKVESEAQLLEKFWEVRVAGGSEGEVCADITRRAAHAMIDSQALAVPTAKVWRKESGEYWDRLLSREVLSRVGPAKSRVAFGHNILFDFAASLYVLSSDPEELDQFLTEAPSRALFLRPSLLYLFANLWNYDRAQYWRLFKGLAGARELPVRLVSRLIPAYVMATGSRSLKDLAPLRGGGWQNSASILVWALQAARFTPDLRLAVWANFTADLLVQPNPIYAWEATLLLRDILARSEDLTPAEEGETKAIREGVAKGGRRLLQHALSQRGRQEANPGWWDSIGSRQALPLVIDTMDVDPESAAELIRSILSLIGESNVPVWYYFWLSQKIETIIRFNPMLAAEVYRTLFSHVEESEEPTVFGSAVLKLQSTRRQDFEGAQYGLVQAFPLFLEAAPLEAISSGLYAGCVQVLRDGILQNVDSDAVERVLAKARRAATLSGATGEWLEDQSTLWPSLGRDDGPQLIRSAAAAVARLARGSDDRLKDVLREYIRQASVSLALAQLLENGADAAAVLAEPLRELALQRAILTSLDLRTALGRFLHNAAPHWTPEGRIEIERSILALLEDESVGLDEQKRTRLIGLLLGALPREYLETPAAREWLQDLEARGDLPKIEPPVRFDVTTTTYTQEDWLAEQGVDLESPENREFREFLIPLEQFREEWRNKNPPPAAADRVVGVLKGVVSEVDDAQVDDLLVREAWTAIAGVAAAVARVESLSPGDGRWALIRDLLIRSLSIYPAPVVPDADTTFTWPSWSPSPQTEAVQGLGSMVWKGDDERVVARFENIALAEPNPALRFLAVSQGLGLFRNEPDRYWKLARQIAENDGNPVVVATLLSGLTRLIWKHSDETREIIQLLWPRWKGSKHRDLVKGMAGNVLILAASAEDQWAFDVLQVIRQEPIEYRELLDQVHFQAAAALTPDATPGPQQQYSSRLRDILCAGIDAIRLSDTLLRERQARGEDLSEQRGKLHEMVDTIAIRLDVKLRSDFGSESDYADFQDTNRALIESYYSLVWPIVESILDFGEAGGVLAARTAHHLLQLFNALLKADPAAVIKAANRAVQAGRADSYNLDSLAVREVVMLMETLLADHRTVLLEGSSLESALQLLDTFAESGWTEALGLIWRLDEAFR